MIYLGCDHGGYELKNVIAKHLLKLQLSFVDSPVMDDEPVDYPDIARSICGKLGEGDKAILVCGTGIGMAMTANKFKGIRAACVSDTFSSKMARAHNDANVLCLGGRVLGAGLAIEIVDAFLATDFEGGRHQNRIQKIEFDSTNNE
ncbi:MAG: ribose 5-phosphate isomerase B [Oscillospiraceae bacterium]|nr:ribose 5-phosphate isomerase B [Oscillospiraceae bacterium]